MHVGMIDAATSRAKLLDAVFEKYTSAVYAPKNRSDAAAKGFKFFDVSARQTCDRSEMCEWQEQQMPFGDLSQTRNNTEIVG